MARIIGDIPREEGERYVEYLEKKHGRKVKELRVEVDGEYVNLHGTFEPQPFERIRRITGYLVGDMSRWNS